MLAKNVATVQKNLTCDDLAGDPTQLPLRAHEIIEDALRDHLSGIDDEGGGAAYAHDVRRHPGRQDGARLPGRLHQRQRDPGLVATADSAAGRARQALLAARANGQWQSLTAVCLDQRQHVDAAIGALLETLASVPDLLEVPPTH